MEFPIELENGVVIHSASAPVWADKDGTCLNCMIEVTGSVFGDDPQSIPFTAAPWDEMEHGRELFESLKDSAGPWVRPDVTVVDLQLELDKIFPDIVLGLADAATITLAKNLRVQIKAMS